MGSAQTQQRPPLKVPKRRGGPSHASEVEEDDLRCVRGGGGATSRFWTPTTTPPPHSPLAGGPLGGGGGLGRGGSGQGQLRSQDPPPLCDIPSGCSFTGPWAVTRSSLRMLRRVAAFCRPLRPVLLLVLFPRSQSPVVCVLGLPPPPPRGWGWVNTCSLWPGGGGGGGGRAPDTHASK